MVCQTKGNVYINWSELKCMENSPKTSYSNAITLPANYAHSWKHACGLLMFFGLAYSCEQFFSAIHYIKNNYWSRLTDESLKSLVHIKTPNTFQIWKS